MQPFNTGLMERSAFISAFAAATRVSKINWFSLCNCTSFLPLVRSQKFVGTCISRRADEEIVIRLQYTNVDVYSGMICAILVNKHTHGTDSFWPELSHRAKNYVCRRNTDEKYRHHWLFREGENYKNPLHFHTSRVNFFKELTSVFIVRLMCLHDSWEAVNVLVCTCELIHSTDKSSLHSSVI